MTDSFAEPTARRLAKAGDLTDPAVALRLARSLHAGQVDKLGGPYATHPERVQRYATAAARHADFDAPQVRRVGVAAAVHDVGEDTPVSVDRLADAGVEGSVARALTLLVHASDEPYDTYVARLCADPIAAAVKAGDLADNLDPRRLMALDGAVAGRLRAKYARPWVRVTAALGLAGLDARRLRADSDAPGWPDRA